MFNQLDDASEKILAIDGSPNENLANRGRHGLLTTTLEGEALEIVRRLHLLSIKQHPELHQFVTQLQSKLIDAYVQSDTSKQKSILDFFKVI